MLDGLALRELSIALSPFQELCATVCRSAILGAFVRCSYNARLPLRLSQLPTVQLSDLPRVAPADMPFPQKEAASATD